MSDPRLRQALLVALVVVALDQLTKALVERTMTSCGYGVPVMEVVRERQRTDRGRRFKPGS